MAKWFGGWKCLASPQESPDIWVGAFLGGVCMFTSCPCGFSPGAPVRSRVDFPLGAFVQVTDKNTSGPWRHTVAAVWRTGLAQSIDFFRDHNV